MKIKLTVEIGGQFWSGGATVEVPELFCKNFAPLRVTDVREFALYPELSGECCSEAAKVVLGLRQDAAKILSGVLTKMILTEMSKGDTHNGYRKGEA